MKNDTAVVWFRQDLRLHDNEAIWEASHAARRIIPVYIFDERVFNGKTSFGFNKTGFFRTRFIIESIKNLRKLLQKKNNDILIRVGKPEEILAEIANEYNASWIYCNRERTQEEVDVQNALEKNLWLTGKELRYTRGKMLYYTADLPFPITHTPDVFTHFRKEVEKFIKVREPLPSELVSLGEKIEDLEYGDIPSMMDFGFKDDGAFAQKYKGGETEALSRLRYYLWETDHISKYKKTRNGLLGMDYSSKFSVYLSQGCLSPKTIYAEIKKYEEERTSNDSTYWLTFELLWRDFFRLMGKKHGNAIFQKEGTIGNTTKELENDKSKFQQWADGETGIPFIDANMKELNQTGFMSNRGRQNVASFLVNDLKVNWLMGAEYFESCLIDYDPCSNYGNWNYIAGVGSDPRPDRYFNIYSQAKRYDPHGEFVKSWLPQLKKLNEQEIHRPDLVDPKILKSKGVKLNVNYPKAMIDSTKWN